MNESENIPKQKKNIIGFYYAWKGIRYFLRERGNARIHVIITLLVVVSGLLIGLTREEWFWVILCIAVVMCAEMINTAVELLTDMVSPHYNKQAGKIKDLAAGAVLLAAIAAALIGSWIFLPRILEFIAGNGAAGY